MLTTLPQLLPARSSTWTLLLIIILVLVLDGLLVTIAISLGIVLVGVKKAYDIVNGAQKLIEFAVNLVVTALAVTFIVACVLTLALINLAALGAIVYYLK